MSDKEVLNALREYNPSLVLYKPSTARFFRFLMILGLIWSIFLGPISWIFLTPSCINGIKGYNAYLRGFYSAKANLEAGQMTRELAETLRKDDSQKQEQQ